MDIDYYRDRASPSTEARVVVQRMDLGPEAIWHRIVFAAIGGSRAEVSLNAEEAADLYLKLKASIQA